MTFRFLLVLILLSPAWARGQSPVLFIYRYQVGSSDTKEEQFTTFFPDDSIFYAKGYAIEKDMTIVQVQREDSVKRSTRLGRLYLIDFEKQRFAQMALDSGTPTLRWQPLSEKKFGIQTNFIYYGNEQYVEKDTVAGHTRQTIVRYTRYAPGRPENAAVFVVYLEKKSSYPILLSNLEGRFHGRVNKIKVIYPANQGQALITLKALNGTDFPLTRKLVKLIDYYRLPTVACLALLDLP